MIYVLATIFVLGLLIFVHELGHFLVAKAVGIRVEKFSLGFPPKLIGFKKGDTEYCISAIPLGGYVKMAGENPDESENTGAPDEFMSKTPLQRGGVVIAGPLTNYVTAIVIVSALFLINGRPVFDEDKMVIGEVAEGSPAEAAGLAVDDVILSVDGTPITGIEKLAEIVMPKKAERVSIEYQRNSKIDTVGLVTKIDTVMNEEGEKVSIGRIGIARKVWWEPVGFLASIELGTERIWKMTVLLFNYMGKLISGQESPKSMAGPLFIAKISGDMAKEGAAALFSLIAFLSVNLAILNILPIPVLDGGHLLFLVAEVFRRKPLSMKQRALLQQIGLAFLMVLIVFVTYNDILRWFRG